MLFGWPFTQSERLHSNLPAPVRVMQSQDRLHRTLRSVPAFRDLRTGSPASSRAGSSRAKSIGERRGDGYELTNFDTAWTHFDPTPTLRHQPSPPLQGQPESRKTLSMENGKIFIEGPDSARPQLPLDNSEEPITDQASPHTTIWKEIRLSVLWIHGSMFLILASLAVLVSVFRVKPEKGLFFEPTGWNHSRQKQYILLSIPASMVTH